jgi:hypothetical protein
MEQGGSGPDRHGHLLTYGWVLGLLEIAVFVGFLAFGTRRQGEANPLRSRFLIGGLVYAGVFTLIILTYRNFLAGDQQVFLGWFPAPTSLMLFGMYLAPYYFVVLYVVSFDSTIARPEDMERFQEMVTERRRRQGGSD